MSDESIEFKIDEKWKRDATLHGVVDGLIELVPELEQHKATVSARIKRLIHHQKLDVYTRLQWYFNELSEGNKNFLELKVQTHQEWSEKSDEDIVT